MYTAIFHLNFNIKCAIFVVVAKTMNSSCKTQFRTATFVLLKDMLCNVILQNICRSSCWALQKCQLLFCDSTSWRMMRPFLGWHLGQMCKTSCPKCSRKYYPYCCNICNRGEKMLQVKNTAWWKSKPLRHIKSYHAKMGIF